MMVERDDATVYYTTNRRNDLTADKKLCFMMGKAKAKLYKLYQIIAYKTMSPFVRHAVAFKTEIRIYTANN